MKNLFIVRFFYDDLELAKRRLDLMNKTLIWSLKNEPGAELLIMTDQETEDLITSMLDWQNIWYLDDYAKIPTFCENRDIDCQTRIDSDDMVFGFSERLRDVRRRITNYPTLINWNYTKYYFDGMNFTKTSFSSQYHAGRTSMFLTLVDPKPKMHVYHCQHSDMHRHVKKVITLGNKWCGYVDHNLQYTKIAPSRRAKVTRFFRKETR